MSVSVQTAGTLPSRPRRSLKSKLRGAAVAARRALKNGDEEVRVALGLAARTLGFEQPLESPLFEPRAFAFRPFAGLSDDWRMTVVTPADGAYMHSFFDVPPVSPSGRYLAVTRLPFEHRGPYPGDLAEITVIDLVEQTAQTVYRTGGWALQLGANLQWHPQADHLLYSNDLIDGLGVGVEINLEELRTRRLGGPIYALHPNGKTAYGPALDLINRTQLGYGVPEPFAGRRPIATGSSSEEGLWCTDLATGRSDLMLTMRELCSAMGDPDLLGAPTHLFHTKINAQGDRLFQVMRSVDLPDRPGAVRSWIATFDPEGRGLCPALRHAEWDRGGHHPSWLPDGKRILMNLVQAGATEMRFVTFPGGPGADSLQRPDRADDGVDAVSDGSVVDPRTASEFGQPALLGPWRGSGHPTLSSDGSRLITDAYLNEGFASSNGGAPLRLIDLNCGTEQVIAEVDCGPQNLRARRVDPHPVWCRSNEKVIFNAVINGRRQVVLAHQPKRPEKGS